VFAHTLQAMRGGSGPRHAVRAYLLTTVRHTAAAWTRTARREQLVDDFAAFAEQAAGGGRAELSDTDTLELGADVRAMQEAERSLALEAFRSLPERWQAVLWHTEVEDESPSEVATLFGLDANAIRHRPTGPTPASPAAGPCQARFRNPAPTDRANSRFACGWSPSGSQQDSRLSGSPVTPAAPPAPAPPAHSAAAV
jgi:hypothetical protein